MEQLFLEIHFTLSMWANKSLILKNQAKQLSGNVIANGNSVVGALVFFFKSIGHSARTLVTCLDS